MHTVIKMYKGLEPHFDYFSAVWDGLTQQLSEKLQNRAMRVITKFTIMGKSSWDTPKKTRFVKHVSFSISNFDVSTPSPLFNVVTR